MHAVLAIAWIVAGAWLYKFCETAFGLPKLPDLTDARYDDAPPSGPALTVIVPARNEEKGIGECLASLVQQDYENLQVIAVDDRSTDATGSLMEEVAAASHGRLRVLHVRELPSEWLGKPHAMGLAAREAIESRNPEYLLFTDGDIVFQPEILRRAIACAVRSNADHFVVMPTTIAKTMPEAALLCYLQTMSLWAVRPWRVADPRAKRDVLGVGAFNLLRREAYLQIGGFEATPMEILEDLYLGRRIKWVGLKQEVAIAPGAVAVHWAAGAGGIAKGMTKNMFAVFRFRPSFLLGSMIWVLLFSLAPFLFVLSAVTRAPGVASVLAIGGVYALFSRVSGLSAGLSICAPWAALMTVYAMLRSMLVTYRDRGVTWRGTFYGLEELRRQMVRPPSNRGAR